MSAPTQEPPQAADPTPGPRLPDKPGVGELGGIALVLVLALVLRLMFAPVSGLDRGMDGFQGAFFALTSVNYERLGADAVGGYPIVNVDPIPDAPGTWYVYANHSPLLSLAMWANLAMFAPDAAEGVPWDEAWRHDLPPTRPGDDGFEDVLRLPMYAASLLSILALWWALRAFGGREHALAGAFLYAIAPLAVLEAGLVNYEPPSILCVILAHGFLARWLLGGRPAHLVGTLAFVAAGTAQTFAPLFFAVPLCLFVLVHLARRRGLVAAVRGSLPFGLAALLPVLLHGWWAGRSLEGIGEVPRLSDRVALLFEPLTSGAVPLWSWLKLQLTHLGQFNSDLVVDLALLGGLFALIDVLGAPTPREVAEARETASSGATQSQALEAAAAEERAATRLRAARGHASGLSLLLFLGGLAVLFFYYRHTSDGFLPGTAAQDTFLLNLLPGAAALGGLALVLAGQTLQRVLTAGRAPEQLGLARRHGATLLVAVVVAVTLSANLGRTEQLFQRWRGTSPGTRPLPKVTGARLAELIPPGAVGLYPDAMGFNLAESLYAWRTLLPVTDDVATFEYAVVKIIAGGLEGRPRYLVLPTTPPASAAPQVEAMRLGLATLFPEIASRPPIEVEGWQAWLLEQ
ncbi:MAG: glycosyltransferase family 39 protein [Planctomycetota bacterium]|nr:glycosyltransferase family 39 protein [Planctomycetota bacterium]